MLIVLMLSVFMLSVIVLSVIVLSVIMLSVIMLSVVAPKPTVLSFNRFLQLEQKANIRQNFNERFRFILPNKRRNIDKTMQLNHNDHQVSMLYFFPVIDAPGIS